jgi:copper(I)-binding protein
MRTRVLVACIALLAGTVSACGGDDGISIERPWARASASMQNAGAAYMDITSPNDDALVGASVDSSIAGMVEIHEVVMDDAGAMSMRPAGSVNLPAGETVSLEPGGYHVMMMNLVDALVEGETFVVTLEFADAGSIEVEVEVRSEAP